MQMPIYRADTGESRVGARSSRLREIMRFVVFGAINTLSAYLLYVALLTFLPYAAAYSIAYVLGIFFSYWLNAKFVFREKLRLSAALQYPVIYAVQYVVGLTGLYLLIERTRVSAAVAPFIMALVTSPLAYLLSRFVIRRQWVRGPERG